MSCLPAALNVPVNPGAGCLHGLRNGLEMTLHRRSIGRRFVAEAVGPEPVVIRARDEHDYVPMPTVPECNSCRGGFVVHFSSPFLIGIDEVCDPAPIPYVRQRTQQAAAFGAATVRLAVIEITRCASQLLGERYNA